LPLFGGQKGVVLVPNSCVKAVTGCDPDADIAPFRRLGACGRAWLTEWPWVVVLADAPALNAARDMAVPTIAMAPTDPASQLLR
jgi:hypothetical protein